MIKLMWFVDAETVPWSSPSRAEPVVQPRRVTRNQVLGDGHHTGAPHGTIHVAYFDDVAHLEQFGPSAAGDAGVGGGQAVTELVLRGEDWLNGRWSSGAPRYKHMALARRAPGLSPTQFAARWRAHAGSAGTTPIPDRLRGQAYAQNHPVSVADEVRYDAVNEVWFDDLDHLRARHRWLTDTLASAAQSNEADDDLFGERHLLIVEETVIAETGIAETGIDETGIAPTS